jgi:hypothetical protein
VYGTLVDRLQDNVDVVMLQDFLSTPSCARCW